jgi:uncharacterized protein (TIGR02118 family)
MRSGFSSTGIWERNTTMESTSMGAKVIAFYKHPENPEAFEKRYFEEHVPLVRKMPGLRSLTVSKSRGKDAPYYLMAEMVFDSVDEMRAALRTPEAAATVEDVMEFAADLVTIMQVEMVDVWDPEADAV